MNELTNYNNSSTAKHSHSVSHGESLWSIAKTDLLRETDHVANKEIALQVLKIERENKLQNPDKIYVNDQLVLPPLQLVSGGQSNVPEVGGRGSDQSAPPIPPKPTDGPASTSHAAYAISSRGQPAAPESQPVSVIQDSHPNENRPRSGEDLIASFISGQAGRAIATRVLQIGLFAVEKNPIAGAVILGVGTIAGTTIAREAIDEVSHVFLHTKRLTPTELAVQSLAGAGGAIVSKDLPRVFGKGQGKFIEKTVTSGASFGAVNAGMVNPFVTDPHTGEHFTTTESIDSFSNSVVDGAAFGAITYLPGKAAGYAFNAGKKGIGAAIDWLKPHF